MTLLFAEVNQLRKSESMNVSRCVFIHSRSCHVQPGIEECSILGIKRNVGWGWNCGGAALSLLDMMLVGRE